MQSRWQALMDKLGFEQNLSDYESLVARYSGVDRHYHNLNHISDCLDKLNFYRRFNKNNAVTEQQLHAIELSLWFHDAIYQVFRNDNEERSADLAKAFLNKNCSNLPDIALPDIALVEELILATKSHSEDYNRIEIQIMLDIDLSILGAGVEAFLNYQESIRKEYRLVPTVVYRKKRKSVLQSFLNMPRIYRTSVFYDKFESQARSNLTTEQSSL